MIAYAGMVRLNAGATADLRSIRPRWPLAELPEAIDAPVLAAGDVYIPISNIWFLMIKRSKAGSRLYVRFSIARPYIALTV